jgi:hypothetical protein
VSNEKKGGLKDDCGCFESGTLNIDVYFLTCCFLLFNVFPLPVPLNTAKVIDDFFIDRRRAENRSDSLIE